MLEGAQVTLFAVAVGKELTELGAIVVSEQIKVLYGDHPHLCCVVFLFRVGHVKFRGIS